MSQLRPLALLGIPPRAIRLAGSPSSFALSRWAAVAATNTAKTEAVVTLASDAQFCVLSADWLVTKPALVAQHERAIVAAAEGGAFRVDVGEGAHFLVDPHKLIGTLGAVQSRIVYDESRLDVLWAWTRHVWWRALAGARAGSSFTRRWLARIPALTKRRQAKGATLTTPSKSTSDRAPRLELPPAAHHYWRKTAAASGRLWSAATARSFEFTHPPRLEIQGPCSVLIKP